MHAQESVAIDRENEFCHAFHLVIGIAAAAQRLCLTLALAAQNVKFLLRVQLLKRVGLGWFGFAGKARLDLPFLLDHFHNDRYKLWAADWSVFTPVCSS